MKYIAIVLLLFSLLACSKRAEEAATATDSAVVDPAQLDNKAELQLVSQPDLYSDGKTKLIKTVDYRFQVKSVKESTDAIEAAIRKFPAYISSTNLHLENPILENKMTIRVRSEVFQDLLKEIDKQAVFVNYRNVQTEDVAKQFVDLESRLRSKREVEERYTEILRHRTGTIEEVLNAEKQIEELHEEIEATVSRINFLREQVSYSTINLEFYQTITEKVTAADQPAISDKFGTALGTGWDGLLTLLIALVYIWPLLFVPMGVITYLYLKRRQERFRTQPRT